MTILAFLALAVPLQGVAAVAMISCGPAHQRMLERFESGGHPLEHHAGEIAGASHHHAGQTADHGAPYPALDGFECSACASCCAGAAITGSAYRVPEFQPIPVVLDFAEQSGEVGFVPEAPEHPPRHFRNS